jgi:hypothetical protein
MRATDSLLAAPLLRTSTERADLASSHACSASAKQASARDRSPARRSSNPAVGALRSGARFCLRPSWPRWRGPGGRDGCAEGERASAGRGSGVCDLARRAAAAVRDLTEDPGLRSPSAWARGQSSWSTWWSKGGSFRTTCTGATAGSTWPSSCSRLPYSPHRRGGPRAPTGLSSPRPHRRTRAQPLTPLPGT